MRGLSDAQAAKLVALGMSERAVRIDTHERFVDGTIYDGRPAFDDDDSGLPLSERRPSVIHLGVKSGIKSLGDMIFGPEGFPRVTSAPSEDDRALEGADGLSEDDSEYFDHYVGKIVEQGRLRVVGKQILAAAQGAGTVGILVGVRAGKIRFSTIPAKCCEPEFDPEDPSRLTRLIVSYRYIRKERDTDGKVRPHVYQYRRVIDEESDVTYVPVEVVRETQNPVPSVQDKKNSVAHGLGFCPAHWYERAREESEEGDRDGHPIHEGLLGLIDAICQSLSQRHRAAIYCGDPQVIETGVEDDEVRVPVGESAGGAPGGSPTSDTTGWRQGLDGQAGTWSGTRSAKRKKGAGTVWRYQGESAKVYYLSPEQGALAILDEDAEDNIGRLREGLSVVEFDADKLAGSGDISGKTLAFIYRKQTAACNAEREDFWTGCMLPVLGIALRIIRKMAKSIYLPGTKKVLPLIDRFEKQLESEAEGQTRWFDPPLRPLWPDYFEASNQEENQRVNTVATATEKGLITEETASQHLGKVFRDIKDPNQYADAIRKNRDDKQKRALELAQASKPAAPTASDKPPTPPSGGGRNPGSVGGGKTQSGPGGSAKGKSDGKRRKANAA